MPNVNELQVRRVKIPLFAITKKVKKGNKPVEIKLGGKVDAYIKALHAQKPAELNPDGSVKTPEVPGWPVFVAAIAKAAGIFARIQKLPVEDNERNEADCLKMYNPLRKAYRQKRNGDLPELLGVPEVARKASEGYDYDSAEEFDFDSVELDDVTL